MDPCFSVMVTLSVLETCRLNGDGWKPKEGYQAITIHGLVNVLIEHHPNIGDIIPKWDIYQTLQYEEQVEEVVTGRSDGPITFAEEFTTHT